jgi:lysozyme
MKKLNIPRFSVGKIERRTLVIFLAGLTGSIAGMGALLFYLGIIIANEPDRKQFPIRGIDISSHQQQIDWDKLDRSPIDFILIKATEGGNFRDPLFNSNWQHARQKGKIVGAYHFFTFCKSGREQAQNYIDTVPRSPQTLPPVIDLEFSGNCRSQPTSAALARELQTFISIVENTYHKKPILYVTYEFYDRYLANRSSNQPIWISDFYSFNKLPLLSDRQTWLFWQYSERGSIAGISTPVDLNVFNGTKTQFDRLVNLEIIPQ